MANITLKDICKTYSNGVSAVDHFNLEIKDKEFIIFVGPSGCGKSTTLRMIAGLEDITAGELMIDGDLINDVPARDRDVAMVFQSYAVRRAETESGDGGGDRERAKGIPDGRTALQPGRQTARADEGGDRPAP